jgi:hypothetical protein
MNECAVFRCLMLRDEGSIFRWFVSGRTALPAAVPRGGGQQGRPTGDKPTKSRPPGPDRTGQAQGIRISP